SCFSDDQPWGEFQGRCRCVGPSVPSDDRALCQAQRGSLGACGPAMARRCGMNADRLSQLLDAYIDLRQAVGFQMRAHRTLLRDFVRFVAQHGEQGPPRAPPAVDWASSSKALRTRGGVASRLSMARGFLTYLRAFDPATEVPAPGLVAAARRPPPYLFSPPQLHALIMAALASGPPETLWPY